jgi:hypothetical protein
MDGEMKAFFKGLDSQIHKGSVWDQFEDANGVIKKQIDKEEQIQANIQADKQRKEEEKKKWEAWDARIPEDSIRLLLPGVAKSLQDNGTKITANLSEESALIKEERVGSLLKLENYSTDELKTKLESAKNLQISYTTEAMLADGDISRDSLKLLAKDQACLVSMYQEELDRRSEL